MVPHVVRLPARSSELPLLGLSKDRPSVVLLVRESTPGRRTPGRPGAPPPSGRSCQLPPRSDPVVSHHLAGFLLPAGTHVLQCVSDPGVHPVSTAVARSARSCEPAAPTPPGFPGMRSCPPKPSLRAQQPAPFLAEPHQREIVTARQSPVATFTGLLALSLSTAVPAHEKSPSHSQEPRPSLKAFLRARVRCRRGRCRPPVTRCFPGLGWLAVP